MIWGTTVGGIKGDTRSLDYGSCQHSAAKSCHLLGPCWDTSGI